MRTRSRAGSSSTNRSGETAGPTGSAVSRGIWVTISGPHQDRSAGPSAVMVASAAAGFIASTRPGTDRLRGVRGADRISMDGKVALVTGAGSADGIGFAAARLLGRRGASVAITSTTDRIHDRTRELSEEGIDAVGYV